MIGQRAGSSPAYPFMEAIKIPISICPHFSQGKPRGHYVLAKKLFKGHQPILARQQFVGYNGFLFVTVEHPNKCDTVFKIANYAQEMDGRQIIWLGSVHQYLMQGGFKVYLPEHILKAKEPGRVEGIGVFRKHEAPGFSIYYLELPKLTGKVLLGKEDLK